MKWGALTGFKLTPISLILSAVPHFLESRSHAESLRRMASTIANIQDFTGEEMADFAEEQVRKVVKARWRRPLGSGKATLSWPMSSGCGAP